MKKIITMIITIALVAVCAISASAEDYSALRVETGDKEDGGYAAVDVLGASCDGNAKFDNTGIALEGETEAHAFQTTGSYKTGDDDYSVGAEGTVTAAGVNTGAGIGASYEDGNLNIGAKVSAEAVAVEAKGKVTSSAGGVEIGVTGGVKIGAGVHGECSFEDGKLKVEFGAALGVGGDIGFELDVSGLMNKERELDLHGPAVTGPESENVSRIGEFHSTNADGIHTTFATYGTVEPDWHGPASAMNNSNIWNFHGPASAMKG